MKSYYLPEEVFSIVKQFAGIYNMKTCISKMDKDIVTEAQHYLAIQNFLGKTKTKENTTLPYIAGGSNPSNTKKSMIRYIYSKIWTYEIAKEIEKLCLPNVDKKYSVGDEITIRDMIGYDDTCGIITKINDYSISVKPYQLLPQIHSYNVKQHEISSSRNDRFRRSSTCPPKYTTENTFWKVQYYDKSSFKRAKTITTKQSSYMIKNLLKKQNQFEPLWNSDTHLSEFICNKYIDWGQED